MIRTGDLAAQHRSGIAIGCALAFPMHDNDTAREQRSSRPRKILGDWIHDARYIADDWQAPRDGLQRIRLLPEKYDPIPAPAAVTVAGNQALKTACAALTKAASRRRVSLRRASVVRPHPRACAR